MLGSPFLGISKQYLRAFREPDFQDQLEIAVTIVNLQRARLFALRWKRLLLIFILFEVCKHMAFNYLLKSI